MDEHKLGSFLQNYERKCDDTEISFAARNAEEPAKDAESVPLIVNKETPLEETVKLTEDGTKFITDAMLYFEQQRRIQQRQRHFWN